MKPLKLSGNMIAIPLDAKGECVVFQWLRVNCDAYGRDAFECPHCARQFSADDYPGPRCPSDDCPSNEVRA